MTHPDRSGKGPIMLELYDLDMLRRSMNAASIGAV